MSFHYLLSMCIGVTILFCKVCITISIFMQLSISICQGWRWNIWLRRWLRWG